MRLGRVFSDDSYFGAVDMSADLRGQNLGDFAARVRALFTQRRGTISICWMSLISISTIRPDWRKKHLCRMPSVSLKASII